MSSTSRALCLRALASGSKGASAASDCMLQTLASKAKGSLMHKPPPPPRRVWFVHAQPFKTKRACNAGQFLVCMLMSIRRCSHWLQALSGDLSDNAKAKDTYERLSPALLQGCQRPSQHLQGGPVGLGPEDQLEPHWGHLRTSSRSWSTSAPGRPSSCRLKHKLDSS